MKTVNDGSTVRVIFPVDVEQTGPKEVQFPVAPAHFPVLTEEALKTYGRGLSDAELDEWAEDVARYAYTSALRRRIRIV